MGTAHGLGLLCSSDLFRDKSEPGEASGCGPGHSWRSSASKTADAEAVVFDI